MAAVIIVAFEAGAKSAASRLRDTILALLPHAQDQLDFIKSCEEDEPDEEAGETGIMHAECQAAITKAHAALAATQTL